MHARTQRIASAMNWAKTRDGFRCRVCYRSKINGHVMIGSHCFPRNVYDPTDSRLIVTLCFWCDKEFDRIHSLSKRAEWLRQKKLDEFAERMQEVDGRCEEAG